MRDIAKRLGVSTMTVSRALRADASIAAETRTAVLRAVRQLGYVPDKSAGALSSRRSGFVAALTPSLNNPHFGGTIQALAGALEQQGLQLLLGHTAYDRKREESLIRAMLGRKPEAMILVNDGHSASARKLLKQADIPIIEIWDQPKQPIGHVVGFSNRDAMRRLVEALIVLGYRRPVYVGETDDAHTRGAARRQGFVDALAAHRLGEPCLCALGRPPVTMSDGAEALNAVLAKRPDADLIVCVADPLAFGVISASKDRGLRVPDDIAVAGFGDFEIAKISRPTITSVTIDAAAMGLATADLLRALRESPASCNEGFQTLLAPTPPVFRESTARKIRI